MQARRRKTHVNDNQDTACKETVHNMMGTWRGSTTVMGERWCCLREPMQKSAGYQKKDRYKDQRICYQYDYSVTSGMNGFFSHCYWENHFFLEWMESMKEEYLPFLFFCSVSPLIETCVFLNPKPQGLVCLFLTMGVMTESIPWGLMQVDSETAVITVGPTQFHPLNFSLERTKGQGQDQDGETGTTQRI